MPQHLLKWSQENHQQVDDWEFQYSPNGIQWHWVQHVEPVDGCESCYQAQITLPDQVMLVRARAIGPYGESGWSDVKIVPEPMFGLLIGFLALAKVASRKKQPCPG